MRKSTSPGEGKTIAMHGEHLLSGPLQPHQNSVGVLLLPPASLKREVCSPRRDEGGPPQLGSPSSILLIMMMMKSQCWGFFFFLIQALTTE